MRGVVIAANDERALIALRTVRGCAVMEIRGGAQLRIGDVLIGALDGCGDRTVTSLASGVALSVVIRASGITEAEGLRLVEEAAAEAQLSRGAFAARCNPER